MGAFLLDHAPCATLVYFLLHLVSDVFNLKQKLNTTPLRILCLRWLLVSVPTTSSAL